MTGAANITAVAAVRARIVLLVKLTDLLRD